VESAADDGPLTPQSSVHDLALADRSRPVPEPIAVANGNGATRSQRQPETIIVAGPDERPSKFQRVRTDGPWWVSRSSNGGKLFWMHEGTQEMTWKQPLPRTTKLPANVNVDASMRSWTQVVNDAVFFGAPADANDPKARTGICGRAPNPEPLKTTCEQLTGEHMLYPSEFLRSVGVKLYLMCEELNYNGQRRRDVPDLATGTLYIDVGDRSVRRKRHSFHHELWHMVDYHLLGNAFEGPDFEWAVYNTPGFQYGRGGKHMRGDTMSSQLTSSPSPEFLNRYSTSSIAEDKAEIWASLMCYQHVLKTEPLRAKAALLKKRVLALCSGMDDAWWVRVREAQLKQTDHWEMQYSEQYAGRPFWINWVTGEKRWSKPPIEPPESLPTGHGARDCEE